MPLLAGLLLAFGAALATGVASVLQAIAARRESDDDAVRLVLTPLYIAGTAFDLLGFLCTIAALHWLPLFLVQCAAASSIGVTALVGRRVLATRLRHYDMVALLGLGAGLVLLASGAKAEAATQVNRSAQWWVVVAAAPILVVGALLARFRGPRAGGVLAAVSGLAFAGTAVASRILSDAHSWTSVLRSPALYSLAAFGIGGMVFFAASLQRTPVTIATAALFGVQTLAASAVGLLVLGDSTRAGFGAVTVVGFIVTLTCVLTLALSTAGTERPGSSVGAAATADGVPG